MGWERDSLPSDTDARAIGIREPARSPGDILPTQQGLAPGELVTHNMAALLSRRGRGEVRVRILGPISLGWLEVAEGWGTRIEVIVQGQVSDPVLAHQFQSIRRIDYNNAFDLDPPFPWDGIALATVAEEDDWGLVNNFLPSWKPLVIVLAYPTCLSRRQLQRMIPGLGP